MILWAEIDFIKAREAELISKLDMNSKSMSQFTSSPFGSRTFLFSEIPEKPNKHPLIPVLNFTKIFEMREKDTKDEVFDIEEKKKELGYDVPDA